MIKFQEVDGIYQKNFYGLLNAMTSNSTNLDKSSYVIPYTNPEMAAYKTSDFKLCVIDNIFIKKYIDKLKSRRESRMVSNTKSQLLDHNPWGASIEEYGTPELWYLILAMNNCISFEDFSDMDMYYYVPIDYVLECLQEEQNLLTQKTV